MAHRKLFEVFSCLFMFLCVDYFCNFSWEGKLIIVGLTKLIVIYAYFYTANHEGYTKTILWLPQCYVYSNKKIKSLEWFDHIKFLIYLTKELTSHD